MNVSFQGQLGARGIPVRMLEGSWHNSADGPAHKVDASAGLGVEGPVLRAHPTEGGKFFTRGPMYPRPPQPYIRRAGEGGSRPQKGQNTAHCGRPLYVGQCRESPCLPVTEYAQRI